MTFKSIGKFFKRALGSTGVALFQTALYITAGLLIGSGNPLGYLVLGIATGVTYSVAKYEQSLLEQGVENNGHLVNSVAKIDEPIPIVYGRCRVGGNIVFIKVSGEDNKNLYNAITLGEGVVDDVYDIQLDEKTLLPIIANTQFVNIKTNKNWTFNLRSDIIAVKVNIKIRVTGNGTADNGINTYNVSNHTVEVYEKEVELNVGTNTTRDVIVTWYTIWDANLTGYKKVYGVLNVNFQTGSLSLSVNDVVNYELNIEDYKEGSYPTTVYYNMTSTNVDIVEISVTNFGFDDGLGGIEWRPLDDAKTDFVDYLFFDGSFLYRIEKQNNASSSLWNLVDETDLLFQEFVDNGFMIENYTGTDKYTVALNKLKDNKVALLLSKFIYDENIWKTVPNITVIVDGIYKATPFRTEYHLLVNPVEILYDYMTNTTYGMGIPESKLDMEYDASGNLVGGTWLQAFTYCENKGLTFHSVIKQGKTDEILRMILDHFRGELIYHLGKYKLIYRDLNDEINKNLVYPDIIVLEEGNDSFKISYGDLSTSYDQVEVTYVDETINFKTNKLMIPETVPNNNHTTNKTTLSLHGCDYSQAHLLGTYYLERSRLTTTISFTTSSKYIDLKLGQAFKFTYEEWGIIEEWFRCTSIQPNLDGTINITAIKEETTLYDDIYQPMSYDIDITELPSITDVIYFSSDEFTVEEVLAKGNDDRLHSWLKITFTPKPYVDVYEVWLKKADWTDWRLYGSFKSSPIQIPDLVEDWYEVKLIPVTVFGTKNFVNAVSKSIQIVGKYYPPPDILSFTISTQPYGDIILEWQPVDDLDLVGYEVRLGTDWSSASVIAVNHASNNLIYDATGHNGTLTFHIKAIDGVGNYSVNANSQSIQILPPNPVTNIRAEVIDNNVLLRFDEPVPSTFYIRSYEIRKGDSWDTAEVIGEIEGTFTTIFEQQSGNYTYWVAPIDYADNYGTPVSISAFVSEPPDFVFFGQPQFNWNGTKTNAVKDTSGVGGLLIAVNNTETWEDHFINNGMSTIQDFINAGHTFFITPTQLTGQYSEVFDLSALVKSAKITVNLDKQQYGNGNITITPTISVSSDNINWTDYVGYWEVYASNFQYVKVTFDVSSSDNQTLVNFKDGSNILTYLKRKTDEGRASVTDAVNGVVVNFNISFTDVESINVTPEGVNPIIPVVDFADQPNPTSFTVYLFDQNGNKITGSFYWTARGV